MMQKWSGENYIGKRYDDYYVVYGHHRDSDVLDESNFRSIEKHLTEKNAVFEIIRSSHWAVGWIEQIIINENEKESVDIGNDIVKKLEGYPVFNEDDFSNLESEKQYELLQMIINDINNLSPDGKLYWGDEITKDMTDEQILQVIEDTGMVEI